MMSTVLNKATGELMVAGFQSTHINNFSEWISVIDRVSLLNDSLWFVAE